MIRLATTKDLQDIMNIINSAKKYLKEQGSLQWNQDDGYPRELDMLKDIKNNSCYVYIENDEIVGTMSVITTPDENYYEIEGAWLTNDIYASIHRIACKYHGKNIGCKMLLEAEVIVKEKSIYSIKMVQHFLRLVGK